MKCCSRLEELSCKKQKGAKNKLSEQDINILTPCQVAHIAFFVYLIELEERSSGLLSLPLHSSKAMDSHSL